MMLNDAQQKDGRDGSYERCEERRREKEKRSGKVKKRGCLLYDVCKACLAGIGAKKSTEYFISYTKETTVFISKTHTSPHQLQKRNPTHNTE